MQGALYMSAAAVCFSVMALLIRLATRELSPLEVAFFRNLFALTFMMPWLARVGLGRLRTRHIGRHLARAGAGLLGMLAWFSSIALLPLAQATALNFTSPLFATAGAALFLGERVRARRWTATAIGFVGTLVILRPGAETVTSVALLPIGAALCMAVGTLLVKSLSRYDPPGTIVLYMNLFLTPLSLLPALVVWEWPRAPVLAFLVGIGLLAATAHVLLTRAYVRADASAVMPFAYARLPLVTLFAYLAFGEVPSAWFWPGAAMIVGAAIYISQRESSMARPRPVRRESASSALLADEGGERRT